MRGLQAEFMYEHSIKGTLELVSPSRRNLNTEDKCTTVMPRDRVEQAVVPRELV